MKTIRKSIFETNSSSTHTIVIDKTATIKDVNFISFGSIKDSLHFFVITFIPFLTFIERNFCYE